MSVQHETAVYDVTDAKIYPLTADTVVGGSPTFGAGIDVPGISSYSVDPNIISAELKGDGGVVLAKRAKVDRFKAKCTYGKLALDVLAAVMGGTVSDPSASEARYDYSLGASSMPYFGLAVEIPDVDIEAGVGDLHVVHYKCQLTGGTLITGQTDSFGQPTLEFDVIKPTSMARALRVRLLNAQTALAMV